jgi:hypothetical protein
MHKIAMGEVEATPAQVSAAKTLLSKTLPDLKAIEHSGDPDNPMSMRHQIIQRTVVDPSNPDS